MSDRDDTAYALETRALTKRFGPKLALRHLNLRIERGGVHALVGSNGAGKSTLFRIVLGLLEPSVGESWVLGHPSRELDPQTRGRIGLVTEEHTLPGWMRVGALTTMQRSIYPRWCQATFDEVLGHFRVGADQRVKQLSRGERAGLSLALALAQRPDVLILDEPTLGLDVVAKQAVLECLLFAGERDDCTLVYCSHQMDEIERIADHLTILESGELVSTGSPQDFWDRIGCWTLEGFPVPPVATAVPGLLQWRTVDDVEQIVVFDQGAGFGQWLESQGAIGARSTPIGFDRAVNAFLSRHHVTPEMRRVA
ncbi:MAG: ABC transporter ATP-binding protein [Acidobacteriota bacterium]